MQPIDDRGISEARQDHVEVAGEAREYTADHEADELVARHWKAECAHALLVSPDALDHAPERGADKEPQADEYEERECQDYVIKSHAVGEIEQPHVADADTKAAKQQDAVGAAEEG